MSKEFLIRRDLVRLIKKHGPLTIKKGTGDLEFNHCAYADGECYGPVMLSRIIVKGIEAGVFKVLSGDLFDAIVEKEEITIDLSHE